MKINGYAKLHFLLEKVFTSTPKQLYTYSSKNIYNERRDIKIEICNTKSAEVT